MGSVYSLIQDGIKQRISENLCDQIRVLIENI